MSDRVFELIQTVLGGLEWAVILVWLAFCMKAAGLRCFPMVALPLYCAWSRGHNYGIGFLQREIDRINKAGR